MFRCVGTRQVIGALHESSKPTLNVVPIDYADDKDWKANRIFTRSQLWAKKLRGCESIRLCVSQWTRSQATTIGKKRGRFGRYEELLRN